MNEIGINEWIVLFFVAIGALLSLLSSFGLIRLPDVYTRSHAATKSATLGIVFILTGTFLYFILVEGYISARLILGIFFVFLTAPVAGHLICRAAYRTKVPLWNKSVRDELETALQKEDYRVHGENHN